MIEELVDLVAEQRRLASVSAQLRNVSQTSVFRDNPHRRGLYVNARESVARARDELALLAEDLMARLPKG